MTQYVVLSQEIQVAGYDELALFARTFTDLEIAELYASSTVNPFQDTQDDIGWVEVYGADFPLTASDIPVMQNGITRIRWVSDRAAFAIDHWEANIGWRELGRVCVYYDDSSGSVYTQAGEVKSVTIYEWTPERGVIRAILEVESSGVNYRMDVFVTLQRGWTGPRFELYPSPKTDLSKLGSQITYTSYEAAGHIGVFTVGSGSEPWAAWMVEAKAVMAMAWLRSETATTITSSDAYGDSRTSFALRAPQSSSTLKGYNSLRFGIAAFGFFGEAETYRYASGTTSDYADGTASAGYAIQDTQSASTNNTLAVTNGTVHYFDQMPIGKYQLWVRAKVGTGGATCSLSGGWSGTAAVAAGPATTTSTTYAWVYVGETTRGAATNDFGIKAWRSAGSGNVYVDEIAVVPVERRATSDPAYDGVRDLAVENLYDTRAIPELVER